MARSHSHEMRCDEVQSAVATILYFIFYIYIFFLPFLTASVRGYMYGTCTYLDCSRGNGERGTEGGGITTKGHEGKGRDNRLLESVGTPPQRDGSAGGEYISNHEKLDPSICPSIHPPRGCCSVRYQYSDDARRYGDHAQRTTRGGDDKAGVKISCEADYILPLYYFKEKTGDPHRRLGNTP